MYSHFEVREKTDGTSESLINDMLAEFKEQNNQFVPFDKIEDGYVQCINTSNRGYITVQIVEPKYPVDNNTFAVSEDFTKAELYTDEALAVNAQQKEKNG